MSFFEEIKRRNLLRVGVAYAVVAWLLLQISSEWVPALLLPQWIHSAVALLLILGFPVALLFAWAFELTPEGLKKEKDIDRSQPATGNASRKFDFITIGLFAIALIYFAYDKFVLDPQRDVVLVESVRQQNASAMPEIADRSIAVLAFANMSDDSSNEYFSEGLSEELLNLLVKIPELRVAARTSSFSYKGTNTRIAQIGEELNVAYILEGSVRKSGNHVRITAQLIKADDGFHLWSETFDKDLDDIFVVQDEVAAAVVEALQMRLVDAIPTSRQTTPEVYALYLQGLFFNNLADDDNLRKAVTVFKQALAMDPDYAPAWVAIAKTYQYQIRTQAVAPTPGAELAKAAVEKALEVDSNMATAWAGLAYLKRSYEWDWSGAQSAIDRALRLEPNNPDVLGVAASLANTFGQISRYVELFERIVILDPVRLINLRALGTAYIKVGRYDDAIEILNRVVAMNPDYPTGYLDLCIAYLLNGDVANAWAASEKIVSRHQRVQRRAIIHFTVGNEAESKSLTDEYLRIEGRESPIGLALLYAWRGEKDAAFEWLETGFQQRDEALVFILTNVFLANLRTDARYPVLLEKLGLLEAWHAMPLEFREAPKPIITNGN